MVMRALRVVVATATILSIGAFAATMPSGKPEYMLVGVDNKIVFRRNVVLIEGRSKGRADATCFHKILVRDRQTMQWPQPRVARLHLIGLRGGIGGHFRSQGDNGIDLWVYTLDLLQVRGERFPCRQLLPADQPGHLDGAHKTNRGSGGLRLLSSVQQRRGRHSQQDFTTRQVVSIHLCESIIAEATWIRRIRS